MPESPPSVTVMSYDGIAFPVRVASAMAAASGAHFLALRVVIGSPASDMTCDRVAVNLPGEFVLRKAINRIRSF